MLIAQIYWVEDTKPGRIGIMARPRGGDWLEDEIQALCNADIDVLVSLLTDIEAVELKLTGEQEVCAAHQVESVSFPITDRSVPPLSNSTVVVFERLQRDFLAGKSIAIHCRMGIGRASLVAACILALTGMTPDRAFELLAAAHGCPVPDTDEQQAWVHTFVTNYKKGRITGVLPADDT